MKRKITVRSTEYILLFALVVLGILVLGTLKSIKKPVDAFVPVIIAAVFSLALYRFKDTVCLSYDDSGIYISKFKKVVYIPFSQITRIKRENSKITTISELAFGYSLTYEQGDERMSKFFFVPMSKDVELRELKARIHLINPGVWSDD